MIRNNIKKHFHILQNEEGSVIVMALIILVVLTLIGISASSTSVVELQIASNDHFYKIAFYNADSGIYGTPKLISNAINNSSEPVVGANPGSIAQGIDYLPDDGTYVADTFYRQVLGYDAYDGGANDVTFASSISVEVDVERLGQQSIAGGGAEFLSGASGIGIAGSVAIFYGMDADGSGPRNSISNLMAQYRKVVGMPGGL